MDIATCPLVSVNSHYNILINDILYKTKVCVVDLDALCDLLNVLFQLTNFHEIRFIWKEMYNWSYLYSFGYGLMPVKQHSHPTLSFFIMNKDNVGKVVAWRQKWYSLPNRDWLGILICHLEHIIFWPVDLPVDLPRFMYWAFLHPHSAQVQNLTSCQPAIYFYLCGS